MSQCAEPHVIGAPRSLERGGVLVPVAIVLAMAGCLLLFGAPSPRTDVAAKLLALVSGVLTAIYFLWVSHGVSTRQGPQLATVLCACGAGAFLPLMMLSGDGFAGLEGAEGYIAIIVVVGTVLPLLCLQAGIPRLGATSAALVSVLEPVVTLLLALLILGEDPSAVTLAGSALILASMLPALAPQLRSSQ